MDLLNDLNDAQRAAVEYIDGPSLVIAGAGSGKTRVLTYKIAYLLSQGMKPWSIMALTFTNKAAREMKERIGKLVGDDLAQHLYMGTFHSIFSRILRAEAEHIGFNNNFTIYDESDSRSLLKAIIKEMGLDDKAYKPAAVHARISMAKNNLVTAEAYDSDPGILEQNKRAKMPAIGKIYVAYVQRCRQANAMDFDDLLMLTFQLFRDNEEIRQKYAGRFDYILVDGWDYTIYHSDYSVMDGGQLDAPELTIQEAREQILEAHHMEKGRRLLQDYDAVMDKVAEAEELSADHRPSTLEKLAALASDTSAPKSSARSAPEL